MTEKEKGVSGVVRDRQMAVLAVVSVSVALAAAACTSAPPGTLIPTSLPSVGSAPPASPSHVASSTGPTPLPTPYAIALPDEQLQPMERFDTDFPSGLVVAFDSVWTTNEFLDTVTRIDPAGGKVTTITVDPGIGPQRIHATDDAIWASGGGGVVRIDPATNTVSSTIKGFWPEIEVAYGSVWAAGDLAVARIDQHSGEIVDTFASSRQEPLPERAACNVGAANDSLWLSCEGTLDRIDPDTGLIVATIAYDGQSRGIIAAAGELWLVTGSDPFLVPTPELASSTLNRIDPVANRIISGSSVDLVQGASTGWAAVDGTVIWLPTTYGVGPGAGLVLEVDGASGRVLKAFDLSEGKGYGQNAIAFGYGSMWVASGAADQVRRFAMPPS